MADLPDMDEVYAKFARELNVDLGDTPPKFEELSGDALIDATEDWMANGPERVASANNKRAIARAGADFILEGLLRPSLLRPPRATPDEGEKKPEDP
jgi:hypothetical protein